MATGVELIQQHFSKITETQLKQFGQLQSLYSEWNERINVISRKDIEQLYERHVLHSLSIAKVMEFRPGTTVLDIGTGGGFPGIPLAILFPEAKFHLVDSIGKKIKVVNEVAQAIGLTNVTTAHIRAEQIKDTYHFVISRAVTNLSDFVPWTYRKFKKANICALPNGILYLKGGDLTEELAPFKKKAVVYSLSDYFEGEFFETKKVVYLPA